MLPSIIPLFPLPNVVLFPSVFLPLHIFEPRYQEMLADALKGDRLVGIVLLKSGRDDIEEPPPIYEVGCAGLISHAEKLEDGRSNIILRGIQRFRIITEQDGHPYRCAQIQPLPEPSTDTTRGAARHARRHLEDLLAGRLDMPGGVTVPGDMGDEDLVNTLAQYLDFEPVEKQALLERKDIISRSESLIELIEMHALTHQPPTGFQ